MPKLNTGIVSEVLSPQQLRKKAREQEYKIEELQAENAKLREQLSQAKTPEEYNELKVQLKEVTEALQKEKGSTSALIAQAEKQKDVEYAEQIKALEDKIDELIHEIEHILSFDFEEISKLREENSKLRKEKKSDKGRIAGLQSANNKYRTRLREEEKKSRNATSIASSAQARLKELQGRLRETGKAASDRARERAAQGTIKLVEEIDAKRQREIKLSEIKFVKAEKRQEETQASLLDAQEMVLAEFEAGQKAMEDLIKAQREKLISKFGLKEDHKEITSLDGQLEELDKVAEEIRQLVISSGAKAASVARQRVKEEYERRLREQKENFDKEDNMIARVVEQRIKEAREEERAKVSGKIEELEKQHQEKMSKADAETKAVRIKLESDFGVHVRKMIEKAYGAVTVDGTITEQDRKIILNAVNQARKNDKKGQTAIGYNRITETIAQEYLDYIKQSDISAEVVRSFEKTFFSETGATKQGTEKVAVATVDEEDELKQLATAKKIIDKYTTHLTAEKAKDRRWLKIAGFVAVVGIVGSLVGGHFANSFKGEIVGKDVIIDQQTGTIVELGEENKVAIGRADAAETQSGLNEIYGTADTAKANIENGFSSIFQNKQNADNLAGKIGELGLTELKAVSETSEKDYTEIINGAYNEAQKIQHGNPEAESDEEKLSTEAVWNNFEVAFNNQNTEEASNWARVLVARAEKITGNEGQDGYQKTSNEAFEQLVLQVFPNMTVEDVNALMNDNQKLSTALTSANDEIKKLQEENAEKEKENEVLRKENEDLQNPIQTVSIVGEDIKEYSTNLTAGQKGKATSVLFCQYNKLDNLVKILVECDNKGKTYYNYIEFNTSTAYTAPSAENILEELVKSTCRVSSYDTKIENIKQNESKKTVFYSLVGNSNGKRADGIVLSQDELGNFTFKTTTSGSYADATEDFLVGKLLTNLGLERENSTSDITEPEME